MLSTSKKSSWWSDLVWMAILFGAFYALWIGGHALFTPDEGRYSEVAREMLVTRDFITPRLNGVAFLDKPALYYWLQASAIHFFGLKEWALRFWPALLGVIGCLMTYAAGRALFNRRTGILSAIILATNPLYYGAAHYANLDLEVAVFISMTLLFSILALNSTKSRNVFFILAYVCCGLAALTKGLIGIVFPAMIIGTWIILLNRWRELKNMQLIAGILIFITITAPWYYLVQKANPEFMHFFFVTQQFSRFLAKGDFNDQLPMWFYLPIVLIGFLPWSVFVIQAMAQSIKNIWRAKQQHVVELFILLWLVLIFIFFSLPKSKTIGYILPVLPALALITGHYLSNKTKPDYAGIIAFIIISFVVTVSCLAAPFIKALEVPFQLIPYLLATAGLFLFAAISTYYLLRKRALNKIISLFALIACLFLMILANSASVLNQNSIKPLAMQLKPQLQPADEVVAFYKYYQDLPLYLERRITLVADWHAADIPQRDNWVRELWYGMPFQNTQDWLISENTFWQRWYSNKRMIVIMSKNDFAKFVSQAKESVKQAGSYNNAAWVSNYSLS